jgi:hypothetical protein
VIITNADTGERIGSTLAKRSGEWDFEKELDRSPCRVRATSDNQFDEEDVNNAPSNCGDDTGPPPSTVEIKEAKWESGDDKLEVRGYGATQGQRVTITNADTGEMIGSSSTLSSGEWKFSRELDEMGFDQSPCRVRATIDNQYDEQDVKDAPASCSR